MRCLTRHIQKPLPSPACPPPLRKPSGHLLTGGCAGRLSSGKNPHRPDVRRRQPAGCPLPLNSGTCFSGRGSNHRVSRERPASSALIPWAEESWVSASSAHLWREVGCGGFKEAKQQLPPRVPALTKPQVFQNLPGATRVIPVRTSIIT